MLVDHVYVVSSFIMCGTVRVTSLSFLSNKFYSLPFFVTTLLYRRHSICCCYIAFKHNEIRWNRDEVMSDICSVNRNNRRRYTDGELLAWLPYFLAVAMTMVVVSYKCYSH